MSDPLSESRSDSRPDQKSDPIGDNHPVETSNVRDGNIASRLSLVARVMPSAIAIAQPQSGAGKSDYAVLTFEQLDRQSDIIAAGLIERGVGPGRRMVMLVPFSAEFIKLTFAVLKTGATIGLIDPGIDRRHLIDCLSDLRPDGFVAIPKAQWIRRLLRQRFPSAKLNVAVGPRWCLAGPNLGDVVRDGAAILSRDRYEPPTIQRSDPAAVIFTTGSTGPPKGVLYTHGTFHAQVDRIKQRYDIHRGSRDLACFPLFGLFDAVMGVTTVIPDMDPTRPADVDPRRLIEAAEQWDVDQAFGSPALWKTVVRWADENGIADSIRRDGTADRPLGSLRRVLSAGAPVPAETLAKLRLLIHPDAHIHTPYGATEALPIASIESRQIIRETGPAAAKGKGVCVGQRFEGARWRVIEISDDPIERIDQSNEMPRGKIGELIVSGPMVTRRYVVRTDQNAYHKIDDDGVVWHRMGDVGYLDDDDRFWFCGRKNHRVVCGDKTWFTIPCEAIFNADAEVNRSALVGLGSRGAQRPVVVIEPVADGVRTSKRDAELIERLTGLARRNPRTARLDDVRVWNGPLPVDIRHNSKIFRERIAAELTD